jgi:hypothetical protein
VSEPDKHAQSRQSCGDILDVEIVRRLKVVLHLVLGLMLAVAGSAAGAPPLVHTAAPASVVESAVRGQNGLPAGTLTARDGARASAAANTRVSQLFVALAGNGLFIPAPRHAEWIHVKSTTPASVASPWLRPARGPPSAF